MVWDRCALRLSAIDRIGPTVAIRRCSRQPFRDGRLRQYCRDRCDCSANRPGGAETANLTVKPYAGTAALFLPGTAGTRLRTASSIEPRPAMKRLIDD